MMDSKLLKNYQQMKDKDLPPEQEEKIQLELNYEGTHDLPEANSPGIETKASGPAFGDIYAFHDLTDL